LSATPASDNRFRELDVLRGVAAFAVLVYHYSGHARRFFGDFPFDFPLGMYGVQLFFVVSGFVIYYSLERSATIAEFAFSRFSRLFPTYCGALALLFACDLADDRHVWVTGYAVNATMLPKFLGFPFVDDVYWTLEVELVFYVLMAALFFMRLSRFVVPVLLAWLTAAALWWHADPLTHIGNTHAVLLGETYLLLPYAPYFGAGILFYLIRARGLRPEFLGALVLCWLVAGYTGGAQVAGVAAAIFVVVWLAVAGKLRFAINPVTLWLGAISYPLYLVHRNLGYIGMDWLHAHGASSWVAVIVMATAALLLATLVSLLIERPGMRYLRGWYRNRVRGADAARSLPRPAAETRSGG